MSCDHTRSQEGGSGSTQQKAVAVACGGWHTAVIGENGGVWMCGRGEFGRLGLGDEKSQVRKCFGWLFVSGWI